MNSLKMDESFRSSPLKTLHVISQVGGLLAKVRLMRNKFKEAVPIQCKQGFSNNNRKKGYLKM